MQMPIGLGNMMLRALLDSGSTHNFVSKEEAHRTCLPLQPHTRLHITITNREHVLCSGVLRQAPFTVNDELFSADLFVLPLGGYDVVLGMQWLANLARSFGILAACPCPSSTMTTTSHGATSPAQLVHNSKLPTASTYSTQSL